MYSSISSFITILIPLYNGVEYLESCLLSIICQKNCSTSVWSVLIGVNGYAFNSPVYNKATSIVQKLSQKYNLSNIFVIDMHYLPKELNQKSNALNELVKLTNSSWIALLDVDDLWEPLKLHHQLPFTSSYDVIGSNCVYFENINNVIPSIPTGDISNANFLKENPLINSSVLIKKKYAHWNVSQPLLEDYELWLRLKYILSSKTNPIKFFNCPEVLVKHRIHKTSFFNSNPLNVNYHAILIKNFSSMSLA